MRYDWPIRHSRSKRRALIRRHPLTRYVLRRRFVTRSTINQPLKTWRMFDILGNLSKNSGQNPSHRHLGINPLGGRAPGESLTNSE